MSVATAVAPVSAMAERTQIAAIELRRRGSFIPTVVIVFLSRCLQSKEVNVIVCRLNLD
jgi:hypothetical protein